MTTLLRALGRLTLGCFLVLAGLAHLTWARDEFAAQVPSWMPLGTDFVVLASGVVEITLGLALLLVRRRRTLVGIVVALFFVAIFPGNIAQYLEGTDAFGLNSDEARFARLFFQPVLVVWALWSTGVWPRPRDRADREQPADDT